MNKKNKLLIGVLTMILIILITVFAVISIIKKQNEENVIVANTDINQRKTINEFLQNNSFISNMNSFEQGLISNTDVIKSAIYSNDVELEYIVTEEIIENEILSSFEGYKKSIDNIKQYSKDVFGKEKIELNFVETYYNNSGYLIINDEYVYFSKPEQIEKVYIAVNQKQEGEFLQVEIYEYTVNENKEMLYKMLETGQIDKNIYTSNNFTIKIKIENDKVISILAKY